MARRKPGRPVERFWAHHDAASSPEVSNARSEARRLLGDTFDRLSGAHAAWKRGEPSRDGAAWWRDLKINEAHEMVAGMTDENPVIAMADLFPDHTTPQVEVRPDGMRMYLRLRQDHPARSEAQRLGAALKTALESLQTAQRCMAAIQALGPDTSPPSKLRSWEDTILRALRPQDHVTPTGLAYFEISAYRKVYPKNERGSEEFKRRVDYWSTRLKRLKRKRPRLVK